MKEDQMETIFSKYRFKNFHRLRIVIYVSIWLTLFALCNQRVALSVASIGFIEDVPKDYDPSKPTILKTNVPIIKILNPSSNTETKNEEKCPNRASEPKEGVLEGTTRVKWDVEKREISFLTYNIGYMIGHVPGTFLTVKIGIHAVMMICIISCTILTLISIFIVKDFVIFIIVRVAIGFISGSMYPIVNEAVAVHSPPHEQHIVHMCIHTANFLSSAIIFPLGGFLIEYYPNGWKGVFYFAFAIGILASLMWSVFVWSEPDENPLMSRHEQKFIRTAVYPKGKPPKKTLSNVPYVKIFTDKQLYICAIVHFAKLMILYMNLIGVVTYFSKFFNLGPLQAGSLGVIPFMAECFLQLTYSHLTTYFIGDKLTKTQTRRLNTLIGATFCAIFLIGGGFVTCHNLVAGVVMQSLGLMFVAPFQGGYFLGIVERYGRFSGITFSFINIAGSLSGVVQRSIFIGLKKTFGDDIQSTYKYSFINAGLIAFFLSLPYVFFGVVDKPEWVQPSVTVPPANVIIVNDSEKEIELSENSDSEEGLKA